MIKPQQPPLRVRPPAAFPHFWLLVCLLLGAGLAPAAPLHAQGQPSGEPSCRFNQPATTAPPSGPAQGPAILIARCGISDVTDWEAGAVDGLIVTNNAGGELRLIEDETSGTFVSAPFATLFPFNAAGATWRADIPQGTDLQIELREYRPITDTAALSQEDGWGPWQRLVAGDARSQADDGAFASPDVAAFPAGSGYLQLRATFTSSVPRASAVLSSIEVAYVDSTLSRQTISPAGVDRKPILFGPDTLTPRPTLIDRERWSFQRISARPERADPRGIIIHQIDLPGGVDEPFRYLRALVAYQMEVLGWDDMAYHYVIDASGVLYEGRLGGPTSAVGRLSGGDTAVHVALMGSAAAAPSAEAQAALVGLLAWLGEAYAISPTGQHPVLAGKERQIRPNIVGHSEAAPAARDPGPPLRDLLAQLRTRADQSTVRARWYFAEGNTLDYSERLVFYNPGDAQASATVRLLRSAGGSPITRDVTVPARGRADLVVNDVAPGSPGVTAMVESSAPLLAERSLALTTDIDGGPGISQPSRVWYFAEGSTADTFRTYLVLFNPQVTATVARITYMRGAGAEVEQQVTIPANQRYVVTVGDVPGMAGSSFGVRIIASQPIAAERTMRFGPNLTGLHTGRGIVELSRRWLFAEGTTEKLFQMRLLLLNPNPAIANTTLTFLTPDGKPVVRRYALPPTTRLAVNVNEVIPDLGISVTVDSDRPIVAERALYFDLGGGSAGTVAAGATQPAYQWRFVDGRTLDASYYLLFSNPNTRKTTVTAEFVLANGSRSTRSVEVPANARSTMAVHEIVPDQPAVVALVRATLPIVAERSFYPGGGARGGASSLGIPAN